MLYFLIPHRIFLLLSSTNKIKFYKSSFCNIRLCMYLPMQNDPLNSTTKSTDEIQNRFDGIIPFFL